MRQKPFQFFFKLENKYIKKELKELNTSYK
jgi:hypothetical protein